MNDLAAERIQVEREEDGPSFLANLPVILKQRKWLVSIPFVLLSIAGIAAALLFPTTYRSSAVLLVESQELPKDLIGTLDPALIDERMERIRQQVLSRGDLIQLIQQHGLYAEERRTKPLSKIIEQMREDTQIAAVSSEIGQGQGGGESNTIAFRMSFDYHEAEPAQLVMQDYVNRFLQLDATAQTEQAATTLSFLESQAATIQRQLSAVERQLTYVKATDGAALAPMSVSTSSGASYSTQIMALQQENAQLARQASRPVQKDPIVVGAETQLAATLARYSETHPDVRLARQRLEEARRLAASNAVPDDSASLRSQIQANNQQIAALRAAQASEAAQTTQIIGNAQRGPAVQEQAAQLQARADQLREQYNEVSNRLLSARGASRTLTEQRGERLVVIDPPVVPDAPESPNRPLFIAAGLALGLGLGLALALAVELLQRPIRGVWPLEQMFGRPPLVVVPTLSRKKQHSKLPFFRRWSRA